MIRISGSGKTLFSFNNRYFSPFSGIFIITPFEEHMLYNSLPYITLYTNLSILDYHNGEQPEDDRRGEQSN